MRHAVYLHKPTTSREITCRWRASCPTMQCSCIINYSLTGRERWHVNFGLDTIYLSALCRSSVLGNRHMCWGVVWIVKSTITTHLSTGSMVQLRWVQVLFYWYFSIATDHMWVGGVVHTGPLHQNNNTSTAQANIIINAHTFILYQ